MADASFLYPRSLDALAPLPSGRGGYALYATGESYEWVAPAALSHPLLTEPYACVHLAQAGASMHVAATSAGAATIRKNGVVVGTAAPGTPLALTNMARGDIVAADKPVSVVTGSASSGASYDATSAIWGRYASTRLGRGDVFGGAAETPHRLTLIAPAATIAALSIGGASSSLALAAGVAADNTTGGAVPVYAAAPGLLLGLASATNGGSDWARISPLIPGAKKLYGVSSGAARVYAPEGAAVAYRDSSGAEGGASLAAHASAALPGGGVLQNAPGVCLQSDRHVFAASHSDGSGGNAAPWLPLSLMGQRGALARGAAYLSLVSAAPATVTLTYPAAAGGGTATLATTRAAGAHPEAPYSAYATPATLGLVGGVIPAGTLIDATAPLRAVVEHPTDGDELLVDMW